MGNSHSHKRNPQTHTQANLISRINLGCHSFDSLTTIDHEKATLDDRPVSSADDHCHCLSKKRSQVGLSHKRSAPLLPVLRTPASLPPSLPPAIYHSALQNISIQGCVKDYQTFLADFPEYRLTWILDALRRSDFQRLDNAGETYVDYMGGALYPESLLHLHTDFLSHAIMGNTHSASNP